MLKLDMLIYLDRNYHTEYDQINEKVFLLNESYS